MKKFPFFKWLFAFLSATVAFATARPLAIGPSLVDGEDLTGDSAHMDGEVHSVWLGNRGVVVWTTWAPDSEGSVIMGAAFDSDGNLLGGPPVRLAERFPSFSSLANDAIALSASGNEVLLVWQSPALGVLARRMNPDLAWLDAAPALLLPPHLFHQLPFERTLCATANGERHGVVVVNPATDPPSGTPGITFFRLGPASPPAPEKLIINAADGTYAWGAAVAARSDGFLFTWTTTGLSGTNSMVHAAKTGPSGPIAGAQQSWPAETGYAAASTSIAPLGEGYAVAWTESGLSGQSSAGQYLRRWRRLDAAGIPVSDVQELFPVDSIGSVSIFAARVTLHQVNAGLLAIADEAVPGNVAPYRRLIRRTLSADGALGASGPFSEAQAMMPESTFVHATGAGLLALGEVRTRSIESFRRSVTAAPLTAGYTWGQPSHVLSQGRPEQQACAVACRGADYLVVWQDGRDGHALGAEIRGRFIALDGTPAGPSFQISRASSDDISPSVAASGGKYLVAWTADKGDASGGNVRAAFVSSPEAVSASFSVASAEGRDEHGVSVAGGPGGGFFAAWRNDPFTNNDDIYGAWIAGDGTVSPVNGFPVGDAPGKQRAVSVAGGGSTYGVVWREGNSDSSAAYGAVVPGSPAAVPVTPANVVFAPGSSQAHAPAIAWNGSQYRAVWYRRGLAVESATLNESGAKGETVIARNRGTTPAIAPRGTGWEVFAFDGGVALASLNAAGEVVDSSRFARRFSAEETLAAAVAPDGGILIAYSTGLIENGREPARGNHVSSGGIETVLVYPERKAIDPVLSVAPEGALTTLHWKIDPYFPRDAGLIEFSPNFQTWSPVLRYPLVITAEGTGDDAIVTFPSLPGARQFFRLNSSSPGSLLPP